MPIRVVILDRDEESRRLFERLLVNCGYHVRVASDGATCRLEMDELCPDVLLVKQSQLNDERGKLRQWLTEFHPHVEVIMMASDKPTRRQSEPTTSMPIHRLEKPWHCERLLASLFDITSEILESSHALSCAEKHEHAYNEA